MRIIKSDRLDLLVVDFSNEEAEIMCSILGESHRIMKERPFKIVDIMKRKGLSGNALQMSKDNPVQFVGQLSNLTVLFLSMFNRCRKEAREDPEFETAFQFSSETKLAFTTCISVFLLDLVENAVEKSVSDFSFTGRTIEMIQLGKDVLFELGDDR